MGSGAPPSKIHTHIHIYIYIYIVLHIYTYYIWISICGLTFTLLNWEESGPCKVFSWPAKPIEQDCRAKVSYSNLNPWGLQDSYWWLESRPSHGQGKIWNDMVLSSYYAFYLAWLSNKPSHPEYSFTSRIFNIGSQHPVMTFIEIVYIFIYIYIIDNI